MQRTPFGSRSFVVFESLRGRGSLREALAPLALLGSALLPASLLAPTGGCAEVEPLPIMQNASTTDGADMTPVGKGPGASDGGADLATAPDAAIAASGCDLHQVRLNELATGGAGGATDEFIELYNPCSAPAALDGGKLVYRAAAAGSDSYTLYAFSGQAVPAHGYFVVANGGFSGTADLKPYQNGSGLAASGGGIALRDATDAIIDSLGWGTATNGFVEGHVVAAPSASQSLARKPDGADTDDNSVDFVLAVPTPRAPN